MGQKKYFFLSLACAILVISETVSKCAPKVTKMFDKQMNGGKLSDVCFTDCDKACHAAKQCVGVNVDLNMLPFKCYLVEKPCRLLPAPLFVHKLFDRTLCDTDSVDDTLKQIEYAKKIKCTPQFTKTPNKKPCSGGAKIIVLFNSDCAMACVHQPGCVGFTLCKATKKCVIFKVIKSLLDDEGFDYYAIDRNVCNDNKDSFAGCHPKATNMMNRKSGAASKTPAPVNTFILCKYLCIKQADCLGFNFDMNTNPGKCYLATKKCSGKDAKGVIYVDIDKNSCEPCSK